MTHGNEIKPGDTIVFLGRTHLIDVIEPYHHPTLGVTAGIARSADGFAMTLFGCSVVEVVEIV